MNITSGREVKRNTLRHLVIVMAMATVLALSAGAALAKGNDFPLITSDKVSGMKQNDRGMLKGYVTSQGENRYSFKDDAGTITVLMSDVQWEAAHATSTDMVELYGKTSREGENMMFRVRRANKVGEAIGDQAPLQERANGN